MLKTAFLLLNMELGYCKAVLVKLESQKEIKYVFNLYGVYDVLVKVECDTIDAVKDFIADTIRTLPDIRSSLTMLAVEDIAVKR